MSQWRRWTAKPENAKVSTAPCFILQSQCFQFIYDFATLGRNSLGLSHWLECCCLPSSHPLFLFLNCFPVLTHTMQLSSSATFLPSLTFVFTSPLPHLTTMALRSSHLSPRRLYYCYYVALLSSDWELADSLIFLSLNFFLLSTHSLISPVVSSPPSTSFLHQLNYLLDHRHFELRYVWQQNKWRVASARVTWHDGWIWQDRKADDDLDCRTQGSNEASQHQQCHCIPCM